MKPGLIGNQMEFLAEETLSSETIEDKVDDDGNIVVIIPKVEL